MHFTFPTQFFLSRAIFTFRSTPQRKQLKCSVQLSFLPLKLCLFNQMFTGVNLTNIIIGRIRINVRPTFIFYVLGLRFIILFKWLNFLLLSTNNCLRNFRSKFFTNWSIQFPRILLGYNFISLVTNWDWLSLDILPLCSFCDSGSAKQISSTLSPAKFINNVCFLFI